MSLYNGIAVTSWISLGLYSDYYGVGDEQNLANLYASLGLIEGAAAEADPALSVKSIRNKGPHSKYGLDNLIGRHTRSVG